VNPPNASDDRRLNPLLKMAVLAGVATAVRLHVGRGDDLDARDGEGMTPLMLAAAKNKAAICDLLLDSGADPLLTDFCGRDALAIAREAGASAAALILARPRSAANASRAVERQPSPSPDDEQVHRDGAPRDLATPRLWETVNTSDDFDLVGTTAWEPEHDHAPPGGNPALGAAATVAHHILSKHTPTDLDEDWDDFKAFLPEHAVDGRALGVHEARREQLGELMLRAIREGSVPQGGVEAICADVHGVRVPEAESLLRIVLCDLGAETDERIESDAFLHDLGEGNNLEEDAYVSEAIGFLDDLSSGRNDPLKIYVKEMSRRKLLRAEEEQALAQEIEAGRECALDALASWPHGVAALLSKASQVSEGATDMEEISASVEMQPLAEGDAAQPSFDEYPEASDDLEDSDGIVSTAVADFLERIALVDRLKANAGTGGRGQQALRKALAALNMSTDMLHDLTKTVDIQSEPARLFSASMARQAVARERLMLCNLRLALSIAKRYQEKGLPIEDLVQEANLGLLKAVDRFDWRRGFRFSTYATWWIRQAVTRALADKGRTIRVPVHVSELMSRLARDADWIEKTTGRRATARLLAERMKIHPRKVAALLNRMEEPVALDEPDEDGIVFADGLADAASADPLAVAARANLSSIFRRMLSELDPKIAQILIKRVGLDDDEDCTLEEIGKVHGVTRERIRQLEAKGLRKLRHVSRSMALLDFVDFSPTFICKEEDAINSARGARDQKTSEL
jgi:RNA polymerase primary sigma factor